MKTKILALIALFPFTLAAQTLDLSDQERIFNQNLELPGNCRVSLVGYHEAFLNLVLKRGGFFGEREGLQLRERFTLFKRGDGFETYKLLQIDRSPKCHYTDLFKHCTAKRITIMMDLTPEEKIQRLIVRTDQMVDGTVTENLSELKCKH